jgi:hypothetical protein
VGLGVVVGDAEGDDVIEAVVVAVSEGVLDGEEVAVAGTEVGVGDGGGEEESAQAARAESARPRTTP